MQAIRPVTINEPTWEFLLRELRRMSVEERRTLMEQLGYPRPDQYEAETALAVVAERPLPFLLAVGFFERPELLRHTVFQAADGCEWIIEEIGETAQVQRLGDGPSEKWPLERLRRELAASEEFDQLEGEPERYAPAQLQRILDRFGAGKLQSVDDHRPFFEITTDRGRFVVREVADEDEDALEHVRAAFGPAERVTCGGGISQVHKHYRSWEVYRLL